MFPAHEEPYDLLPGAPEDGLQLHYPTPIPQRSYRHSL